jgi:hypothetical protein
MTCFRATPVRAKYSARSKNYDSEWSTPCYSRGEKTVTKRNCGAHGPNTILRVTSRER